MLRRGQVTMFVILGLALLLIVGVVILREPSREPPSLAAQQDAARATAVLESCLSQVGEAALRDVASQGGYADLNGLRATPDQRSTQVVTLAPQRIPLWHEVHPCGDNPDGCLGANRPRLCASDRGCPVSSDGASRSAQSVQEALEMLIAQRIASCVQDVDLAPLIVRATGEPTVTATIREDETLLALEYPLVITATDDTTVEIENYRSSLDVALPRVYRLAAGIAEAERGQAFIEEAFLHLLAVYSGVDTPLPPIREVRLFGGQKLWSRAQVQRTVEEDLLPFLGFLQVLNAQESFTPILPDDPDDPYAPYATGVYEYLVVKLDNTTYPLAARFEYPETPIYLNLGGREIIRPTTLSGGGILAKLAGLVFTQYRVKYTAAFPIVVRVTDPAAFGGDGLELSFGLEGNVRSNYPLNTSAPVVRAVAPDASADIAEPAHLVRHEYAVRATDQRTGQSIDGATVTFVCGARVQMGVTDTDGSWSGRLPYCFAGGAILVEKYGYLTAGKDLVNTEDDDGSSAIDLQVWPLSRVPVLVFKRSPADVAAITQSGPTPDALRQHRTPLGPQDQVLVTIARGKAWAYEDDVPLAGALSLGAIGGGRALGEIVADLDALVDQGVMTAAERDELLANLVAANGTSEGRFVAESAVDLVPGDYDLELLLLYNGRVGIPAEERCEDILGGLGGQQCVTLPAQNLTGWASGGAILTGADAVTLTTEFVYSGRPLVLFALEQPIPRTWGELEGYQDLAQYQTYDRVAMVRPET